MYKPLVGAESPKSLESVNDFAFTSFAEPPAANIPKYEE